MLSRREAALQNAINVPPTNIPIINEIIAVIILKLLSITI